MNEINNKHYDIFYFFSNNLPKQKNKNVYLTNIIKHCFNLSNFFP